MTRFVMGLTVIRSDSHTQSASLTHRAAFGGALAARELGLGRSYADSSAQYSLLR